MPRPYMAVEPRVRRVIAARLGIDGDSLAPEADLPLDAIALVDVARALERTFPVALNDADLARVRSCRDLAMLIARRVAEREAGERDLAAPPVWVRVIPADPRCPLLERLVDLTPYMVETVIEDARVPGRYRRLEVILGPAQPERVVAQVERLLAPARAAGLSVEIHRAGVPRLGVRESAAGQAEEVGRLAGLATRIGQLLYELQQERGLTCLHVAAERRQLGQHLAGQRLATDRVLSDLGQFVTAGAHHLPQPVRAATVKALDALAELPSLRRDAAALDAVIERYGHVDRHLLAAAASIAAVMPDAEYGRLAKSYLALLEARESAAMEGLRPAQAGALDPARWLRVVSGRLERLREVEKGQLAALARRVGALSGAI